MAKKKKKKVKTQPTSATGFPLTPEEAELLVDLLDRLGINDWDILVFGDGSGSNWDRECAWAAVSVERVTMERLVWWGYANRGSVNVSEGMAALWPLMWLANREAKRVEAGQRRRGIKVHVITDSQYVKTRGTSEELPECNSVLWDAVSNLTRQGIVIKWHWVRRETVGLNQYTDQLSRLVRTSYRAYNMQERMSTNGGEEVVKTVYEVNG